MLHLKVQSHCFGVMGGGSGRLAFLSTLLLLRVQNFSLFHFPLRILFHSLLHYVALTKKRDFPDKTVPHSACLCTSIPVLTFLRKNLKGHYLVSTMKYDCVCLLLIMATIGSCNDDKLLAFALCAVGIQPPPATPFKKRREKKERKKTLSILVINKLQFI